MDDHRGRAEDALKLKMLMEQQEIPHDRNGGPTNAYSVPLNLSSQGVNFVRPMPLYAWTHQPTWTSTMPGKCSPHGGSSAPPMLQNVFGQAATNASRHQQLGTAPLQPAMPRSNSSEVGVSTLTPSSSLRDHFQRYHHALRESPQTWSSWVVCFHILNMRNV